MYLSLGTLALKEASEKWGL